MLVQDDSGSVEGADAYIEVTALDTYWASRGVTLAGTTQAKEAAIVNATDYLDSRYTYKGQRRTTEQRTKWPRLDVTDADGLDVYGIPDTIKDACAELARKALSAEIYPDPTYDASGSRVAARREQVGPISRDITFAAQGAYQGGPIYAKVTAMLRSRGLLIVGGELVRG